MAMSMQQQTIVKKSSWWKRSSAPKCGLAVIVLAAILLGVGLIAGIAVIVSNSGSCDTADCAPGEMSPLKAEALFMPPCWLNLRKKISTAVVTTVKRLHATLPVHTKTRKNQPERDICYTAGCQRAASMILKNMDSTVDPCDNFYRYACGGFIKSTIIPKEETTINSFNTVDDKIKEQLRPIIAAESEPNERLHVRLVKNLYKSCMNTSAIEAKGLKPLHAILRRLGGWPVIDGDSWDGSDFDWIRSIYKFRYAGYSTANFFRVGIYEDLRNTTKRVIYLGEAVLGHSREYLIKGLNDKIMSAYYNYMVEIAIILGAQRNRAKRELKESLVFEMKLANITLPRGQRRDVTKLWIPMTLTELIQNYPHIPWKQYFSKLLTSTITVAEDEKVIVAVPSFFKKLATLMSETSKRIQANYVMWRAAAKSVMYLTESVRKKLLEYEAVEFGSTERPARWRECLKEVSDTLPVPVSSMYVKKYFTEDAKKNVVEMVMDIREEFKKILETADWMDEKTRRSALEKAEAMTSHIAYPDEILDDDKLEAAYKNLKMSEDNYFENHLNTKLFVYERRVGQLRKPVNKTDWEDHGQAAEVNGHYKTVKNSIQFPAGILQGTFFSNDRPKYMNYGAIGSIVGHEITHGFDDKGRQFDQNGNLVDWWNSGTKEKFLKRAQCIIDQYGNYTVEEVGLKLNGVNTQGENIADNGAIKEAYRAYNRWVARNGEEKKLPRIGKTPKQLFWISFANTWCSIYRPEALKRRIIMDPHSPEEFRIVGPLSNSPEFANDFGCPEDSKMNPKKKCAFW